MGFQTNYGAITAVTITGGINIADAGTPAQTIAVDASGRQTVNAAVIYPEKGTTRTHWRVTGFNQSFANAVNLCSWTPTGSKNGYITGATAYVGAATSGIIYVYLSITNNSTFSSTDNIAWIAGRGFSVNTSGYCYSLTFAVPYYVPNGTTIYINGYATAGGQAGGSMWGYEI